MTREEIKNRVFEIIADKIGVSVREIYENTRFKEDLGTDSLDDIELLMEFERVFGIRIPDDEMFTVCTVGEAIDGICQKLGVSICKKQQPEVDFEKTVEFECIGKKVKMTVQELINYYIDSKCCDVADECGF